MMVLLVAWALQEAKTPAQIYDETVGSVVAVRGLIYLGERSGSGVVLTPDGLILCSHTTIPEGTERIRVWFKGPKLYTAEYVAGSKDDEITLIRIKPEKELTPIKMGTSRECELGQTVFSLGNVENSYINDDQPAFQRGIISGRYVIPDLHSGATYQGELFESTAAVNNHLEGGPLLNDRGQMVGMVTLNYSPNRWMGHAIPIDWVKDVVDRLKKDAAVAVTPEDVPKGSGTLGLTLKEDGGKVVIASVEAEGPAAAAGLTEGIQVLEISGNPVKDLKSADERLAAISAGALVWLKVDLGGGDIVPVKLRARKKEGP